MADQVFLNDFDLPGEFEECAEDLGLDRGIGEVVYGWMHSRDQSGDFIAFFPERLNGFD